jgi:cytochrome c biogenesis protein CcdA
MDGMVLATGSALWLGLMTSISPCPLASNIAAMSFVARNVGHGRRVLLTGALYTLGRIASYGVLAAAIVAGLSSVPRISFFLQRHMNQIVGPVLLAAAILLMEWVRLPWFAGGVGPAVEARIKKAGLIGGLLLGAFLALAFCPVSAALFFGSLVPLCLEHRSSLWLPSVYGLGTGLPVVVFALLLATGAKWLGSFYRRVVVFELWARRATAAIFVLVGLHYALAYTLPALGWDPGWSR